MKAKCCCGALMIFAYYHDHAEPTWVCSAFVALHPSEFRVPLSESTTG